MENTVPSWTLESGNTLLNFELPLFIDPKTEKVFLVSHDSNTFVYSGDGSMRVRYCRTSRGEFIIVQEVQPGDFLITELTRTLWHIERVSEKVNEQLSWRFFGNHVLLELKDELGLVELGAAALDSKFTAEIKSQILDTATIKLSELKSIGSRSDALINCKSALVTHIVGTLGLVKVQFAS